MTLYNIHPHVFAGLQRWHKESFLTRRTGFSSDEERIIYLVAKSFGISHNDLKSRSHLRDFTTPRQVAIYFIRKYTSKTQQQVGIIFSRDHSTIVNSLKVVNNLMDTDAAFKEKIDLIDKLITKI